MHTSFLLLLALVATTTSLDPPVWPNVWSQQFVQNYTSAGGVYTVGKHWYDYQNSNERVTYQNGQYDNICGSVMPKVNTACTQLISQGNLYVIYPEKQFCCRCCDGASGCQVKNPHWLAPFTYVGEQALSGQNFYKWTYNNLIDYYAKEVESRIPRRIHTAGYRTQDFIMNTYSEDPISRETFEIPAYCKKDCPRDTVCGQIEPGKSLKKE